MDVEINDQGEYYNQKFGAKKKQFLCSDDDDDDDNMCIEQSNINQRQRGYNKFFLNIPERFDHDFEMIKVLGNGSFGTVLKCQSRLDRLLYAVKKRAIKVQSRNRMN